MGETEKPAERQFVVKTPGKFILTGEHAVVYGKLALASSVDLLTEIFLTLHTGRHPSPSIGVCFEDLQFNWSLPLSELPIANACTVPHLNIELMGQLKVLVANRVPPDTSEPVRMSLVALCFLYCTLIGSSSESFTIRVKSAIPIGAGLGSSAAFSVGSSAAFHLLRHVTLNKAKPFEPNLELINDWAFQCEKMFHATPSGIDNAVCTYGGVVKFKTVVIGSVAVPEARILLVNTGVSRQTKFLIESVRKKRNNFPLIVDPILESIDQISHQVADIVQHPVDGNFSSIQELLSTNHWLLASLGVSHQSLDEIHRVARTHHQAAKLTGAGGGGLAFIWLDPACSDGQLMALERELSQKNFICWQTRLGVKGVQIEEL